MVLASHVIFTADGFWLPNDPRGSWSDFVRQWEIARFGPATKTAARHSVARQPHDRTLRLAAKAALQYPPVEFTGIQAAYIARGFAKAIDESHYTLWACSILPTHVHMVIARSERLVERIVGHLKTRTTQQLAAAAQHPFVQYRDEGGRFPSVWAHRAWKVFLDTPDDIQRSIRYVQDNPARDGKKPQHWPFLRPRP